MIAGCLFVHLSYFDLLQVGLVCLSFKSGFGFTDSSKLPFAECCACSLCVGMMTSLKLKIHTHAQCC